ncbi:hypothetical protein HDU96_011029 [Phlyctochytrium bullatum]|nr:hypothetical protein HDU96_011029 [Phlyctochytrium bullatum]
MSASYNVNANNAYPADKGKTIVSGCCCFSLEKGAKVIATLGVIQSVLGTGSAVWTHLRPASSGTSLDRSSQTYLALFYLTVATYAITLPIHILGAVGIFGARLNLVRFYAIAFVLLVPVHGIPSALSAFGLLNDMSEGILILIAGVVLTLIVNAYLAACLWSYYQELRYQQSSSNPLPTLYIHNPVELEAAPRNQKAH